MTQGEKRSHPSPKVKGITECVICRSEIKFGARMCTVCKGFQHPVRRFLSGIDVKSFVALVPVLALAFVFVKDQIVIHKSDLRIAILDCERDKVKVAVSNLGDRAAILQERADLDFFEDGKADSRPRLLLKDPQSLGLPLIKPGESVIIDFLPVSKGGTKVPLDVCPPGAKSCEYKVRFNIIAFDHEAYTIQKSYIVKGTRP